MLFFQARDPTFLPAWGDFWLQSLRKRQVVPRVLPPHLLRLAARYQALQSVLSDRLQHRKTRLSLPTLRRFGQRYQQAVVYQRRQPLQDVASLGFVRAGAAHGFRRFQGAPTGEDGEAPEQRLLADVEEVVAPGDRVAQRPLSLG